MNIKQKFFYVINYKPLLNYKKELKNLNNTIYCKNFFLFFLLLSFLNKKNCKLKISILKKNKNQLSYLRAPNKYKKAQVKLNLVRYRIILTTNLNIKFNDPKFTINKLSYLVNFFFNYFFFMESTLFFMEKKQLFLTLEPSLIKHTFFEL